jgi:serine/threonine protein kinase
LGRDVALKVLPERFAGNPERLARFDREARLLASVNHPNIATIHGVAHSESGPVLVLELIDGQTLQDRLDVGPLPTERSTSHLEAARRRARSGSRPRHRPSRSEAGQHQDSVGWDGQGSRLRDRQAARVRRSRGEASGATVTETDAVAIGTPTQSSEQARGAEVTRRSDVWAFGAVLFEMLTGTVAFSGPTPSDGCRIPQRTPDWSALPPTTPAAITRLLKRCLEREPARLHDVGDARIEIEDAERHCATGSRPRFRARDARHACHDDAWMAAISLATLGVAIYLWSSRRKTPQEVRLSWRRPQGRAVSVPAVLPDGRQRLSRPFPKLAVTSGCGSGHFASAATELARWVSYPFCRRMAFHRILPVED